MGADVTNDIIADKLDDIIAKVHTFTAELTAELAADMDVELPAVAPENLASLELASEILAKVAQLTATLQDIAASGTAPTAALAHRKVLHILRRLRPLYGRRVGAILGCVMGAPCTDTDELVAVLACGRAGVRAVLDITDDPVVRAALLAALRALDELHDIETHAPTKPANVDGPAPAGCEHSPPMLTRCTHHRRHLVKLSTNDADPAPMHRPGATNRRHSPCIGGC